MTINRSVLYKKVMEATDESFRRRDTINHMIARVTIAAVDAILDEMEKRDGDKDAKAFNKVSSEGKVKGRNALPTKE